MVIIDHPMLGRLTIPASRVKSIKPVPEGPILPRGAQPPLPPPAPAPEPPPPPPRWESSFDVGFSGSAGNTQNMDLRVAFTSVYKDPTQRYTIDSSYYLRTSNGD